MRYLLNSIERGRNAWASMVPVVSACAFILVLLVNIDGFHSKITPMINLRYTLTNPELVFLAICSPLLFTRFGNWCAFLATVFLSIRIFSGHGPGLNTAESLVLSLTIILTVTANRMPWSERHLHASLSTRLNEIVLQFFAVFSLISLLFALVHLRGLQVWITNNFGIPLSHAQTFSFVVCTMFFWILASVNSFRVMSLLIVCLPTVIIGSFVLDMPISVLILPFMAIASLSLSQTRQSYFVRG